MRSLGRFGQPCRSTLTPTPLPRCALSAIRVAHICFLCVFTCDLSYTLY